MSSKMDKWAKHLSENNRSGVERHPDGDCLLAFARGELAENEHEKLCDHLILCEDCKDLVLRLKGERSGKYSGKGFADKEVDAAWQVFQSTLGEDSFTDGRAETEPAINGVQGSQTTPGVRRTPPLLPVLVAAAAGAAFFFMGLKLGSSRTLNNDFETTALNSTLNQHPIENPVTLTLFPANQLRREGQKPPSIPSSSPFLLSIFAEGVSDSSQYRLAFLNSGNERIWETESIRVQPDGLFKISFLPGFFDEGFYQIVLSLFEGGSWREINRYGLEIGAAE